MTRNRKKRSDNPRIVGRTLQPRDLAAARGGDNGVIHVEVIGEGSVSTNDNGVLHMG